MHLVVEWLDLLFGMGEENYPFWLMTVRVNVLIFAFCGVSIVVRNLQPTRLRNTSLAPLDILGLLAVTASGAILRLLVAHANVMDFGGIAYSRMLIGYKGYFATAQTFAPLYELTVRNIEHAIVFNRIAGTLTIPLIYFLCRHVAPAVTPLPIVTAFLFATYPLHILFSASDALAVFSVFLAASSYVLLAGARSRDEKSILAGVRYAGGFTGLTLLTQVRYENILLLLPPLVGLLVWRRSIGWRHLALPLLMAIGFLTIYAYEESLSGAFNYRFRADVWANLDTVLWHLLLNPFVAVPALVLLTVLVWWYRGHRLGMLALLPVTCALGLTVVTTDNGHGAARIFANWLVLIVPFAGYGLSLLLSSRQRAVKALAVLAVIYFGSLPWIFRGQLTTQYLEILENDRFNAMLAKLPASVRWIIVPDDELVRRESYSTLEVFQKYAAIFYARPVSAQAAELVSLTDFLEHPEETDCSHAACVFFYGLPCSDESMFKATSGQCRDLLRRFRTTVQEDVSVVAAPFVSCSIYTGAMRERLCDPTTTAKRFAVYGIQEPIGQGSSEP